MYQIKRLTKTCLTIFAIMLILTNVPPTVHAQTNNLDTIVVLYDQSHQEQFKADDEHGFKLMLDMVNASTRYTVRVNKDAPLNATLLNDVDVLIIADPDASEKFSQEEFNGISEFLANGSSLMLLGDPTISQNSTYWNEQFFQDLGENIALNRLLNGLNITGVRFSTNRTGPDVVWADTMFDYDHALNETYPWVLKFDATTWQSTHPIFKDINTLVSMTSTLKPLDDPTIVARSYDSSFAQFRRGPYTWGNLSYPNMTLEAFQEHPYSYSAINGTLPPWMSAFEYDNARIIIGGSAIMFTGRTLDLPDTDSRHDSQWFYMADNSRLFMNMLNWLTAGFESPPSAIIPMTMISTTILVIGVVFYVIKKIRK